MIDLGLAESTSKSHVNRIKKYLKVIDKDPRQVSKGELRSYLKSIKEKWSSCNYKNVLASLKRFYRDYLGIANIVDSFCYPPRSFKPIIVPKREDLQIFYHALPSKRDRALFMIYATSGLRSSEVVNLTMKDIHFEERMLRPQKKENRSKHVWVSFYNDEAENDLEEYLSTHDNISIRLFSITKDHTERIFRKTSNKIGIKVTPQILRDWFCCEMGRLRVPDRYVDAFCGRTPKSVLARHYTDYSPVKLKEIYDRASLKVLD